MVPYRQLCVVLVEFRWPSGVGFWQQPATEEQIGYTLAAASFKLVRPSQWQVYLSPDVALANVHNVILFRVILTVKSGCFAKLH